MTPNEYFNLAMSMGLDEDEANYLTNVALHKLEKGDLK